jgi:hypothetical protein
MLCHIQYLSPGHLIGQLTETFFAEPNRLILHYHPCPMNATAARPSVDACASRDFSWTPETEVASITTFAIALGCFAQSFLTAHPPGWLTMIVAHISQKGKPVADITYRAGIHVEVRVAQEFQSDEIRFPLVHSENGELKGSWEEALDTYFNDGLFDSKDSVFPGEMRRVGSAKEHRSLFQHAAHALLKDLEPHGYEVRVEFV